MINGDLQAYYNIVDKMKISCILKKKYHNDIVNFIKKALQNYADNDYINEIDEISESASWFIRNKIKEEHRKQKKV